MNIQVMHKTLTPSFIWCDSIPFAVHTTQNHIIIGVKAGCVQLMLYTILPPTQDQSKDRIRLATKIIGKSKYKHGYTLKEFQNYAEKFAREVQKVIKKESNDEA